ncbi:hypothetical protein ABIA00_003570 [Bradyrhizobium ottawaense]
MRRATSDTMTMCGTLAMAILLFAGRPIIKHMAYSRFRAAAPARLIQGAGA